MVRSSFWRCAPLGGARKVDLAPVGVDADLLDDLEVLDVALGDGAAKVDQVRRPALVVRDGKGDDLLQRHVVLGRAQDDDRQRLLPHAALDVLGHVEHGRKKVDGVVDAALPPLDLVRDKRHADEGKVDVAAVRERLHNVEDGGVVHGGALHVERDEQPDRGGEHVADARHHLGAVADLVDERLDEQVDAEQRRHDDDERHLLRHEHGARAHVAEEAVVLGEHADDEQVGQLKQQDVQRLVVAPLAVVGVVKKVERRLVAVEQPLVVDLHLFVAALASELVVRADARQHLADGHHELVRIPERVEEDGEHSQRDHDIRPVEGILAHRGGVAKVERRAPDVRIAEQRPWVRMVHAALVRIGHGPKVARPHQRIHGELAERQIEQAEHKDEAGVGEARAARCALVDPALRVEALDGLVGVVCLGHVPEAPQCEGGDGDPDDEEDDCVAKHRDQVESEKGGQGLEDELEDLARSAGGIAAVEIALEVELDGHDLEEIAQRLEAKDAGCECATLHADHHVEDDAEPADGPQASGRLPGTDGVGLELVEVVFFQKHERREHVLAGDGMRRGGELARGGVFTCACLLGLGEAGRDAADDLFCVERVLSDERGVVVKVRRRHLVGILERVQRLLTGALVYAEVALVLPGDLLEQRVGIVVSILVVISQAFPRLRLVVSRQLLGLSRLATLSKLALLFAASAYVHVNAGGVEHGGAADLTASNFEMSRLGAEAALLAG
ncbi:hypothetical protein L1887_47180 [Cichorium endivia]|nr:hypothetical protein L1887_47180 [Cichorium endivia]